MRNVAKLPKTILAMEALGGVLIASALLVVNQWLPAAWLLMWRCAKALAPQLFNLSEKKDN